MDDANLFLIFFLILLAPTLYIYITKQKIARIKERQKKVEEESVYQNFVDAHKDEINNLIDSIKASKDVNEQINIITENKDLKSFLEKKLEEEEPNIYFMINKKIILTQLKTTTLVTLVSFPIIIVVDSVIKREFNYGFQVINKEGRVYIKIHML